MNRFLYSIGNVIFNYVHILGSDTRVNTFMSTS